MRVMTILGTRPEIIRLSLIIKKLDTLCEHTLVHTGQNHSASLKDVFFQDLRIRQPETYLKAESPEVGKQLGRIMEKTHEAILKYQPERILQLGDTNSGLSAIVAEKLGVPVYHMEAGNRCYDKHVPEENNRHIIDITSSYCLPYTPGSRDNLLREGIHPQRVMVSGNPIFEVLTAYEEEIESSQILQKLGIHKNAFFLVTAHRAENVDHEHSLREIFRGLDLVAQKHKLPIICSIHPRTKEKMQRFGVMPKSKLVQLHEPFGFFDFVKMEKNARCAISDSGTVQEECCLFHVPTVTIRRTTERPETIQCGSNILSGLDGERILACVNVMLENPRRWAYPIGYADPDVSEKVTTFILGSNELTV